MSQPAPAASIIPHEIPESFFRGLPDPSAARHRPDAKGHNVTSPMKALVLYDAIIDDLFLHPNATLRETATRLGRGASSISLIVRSDFFRARWLQRREKFNEDLNFRLMNKMAGVLEKSLDTTLEVLNTKGDKIPLPILTEINNGLLDRMGYGPQRGSAGPAVVIQNNSQAVAATQASPEGLAAARGYLKILESQNANSGPSPGPSAESSRADAVGGPVVEGDFQRVES